MNDRETNPEKDQDRVADLIDHFDRFGDVMFKQQRKIYNEIARRIPEGFTILEAGCGNGVGSAILAQDHDVLATDISQRNVNFASCLYRSENIDFATWDVKEECQWSRDAVVAIEVFEHVANPEMVMNRLCHAANQEVWVTSPNGRALESPPSNPYHVSEYTVDEMISFVPNGWNVEPIEWSTFNSYRNSSSSPVVYHLYL
tara:strand:- start:18507 stop:19109 length:603 start_codon:yes stop_codon:yes gene_type:complete